MKKNKEITKEEWVSTVRKKPFIHNFDLNDFFKKFSGEILAALLGIYFFTYTVLLKDGEPKNKDYIAVAIYFLIFLAKYLI